MGLTVVLGLAEAAATGCAVAGCATGLLLSVGVLGGEVTLSVYLTTADGSEWLMRKAGDVTESGSTISTSKYDHAGWRPATVPGTVLNSLVNDGV